MTSSWLLGVIPSVISWLVSHHSLPSVMPRPLLLLLLPLLALHASAFVFKTELAHRQPLELSHNLTSGPLRLLLVPGRVVGLLIDARYTVLILHQLPRASAPLPIRFRSSLPDVLRVLNPDNGTLSVEENAAWPVNASFAETMAVANSSASVHLQLQGVFLGRAEVWLEIQNASGAWQRMEGSLKVSVIRKLRWIDRIFTFVVVGLVMIANLGMGVNLELRVVKKVLRRPLAPVIGFCCQYTLMPLIAFGVGTLLNLRPTILLGYFALGCAPGGGASNFYSYLLGGDVSLSVTMTLVSVLAALGMVPLWLFTLGQHILRNQGHSVKIPFQNIIISLITMLIPIAIGYAIKKKLPRVANIIKKCMKPFLICLLIFFFTVGIYANLYIINCFTPLVMLAGCLLPYGGFFLGGLIAFIARLKLSWVKTVSIETGIQNIGVPILLLKFSLPQPDSDMSIVGPVAAALFTPIPLFISIFIREIYLRKCKKKEEKEEEEGEEEKKEKENEVEKGEEKEAFLEQETKA